MKVYKKLVPILLVVGMVVSAYVLYSGKIDTYKEYNQYLEKARYCKKEGLVDAPTYYEQALNIKKSISIYNELLDCYLKDEDYDSAESIAENIVSDFPKNEDGYYQLMNIYYNKNDYSSIFSTYENSVHRKISSERIDKIYKKVENLYTEGDSVYSDIIDEKNGYYCAEDSNGNWGYLDSSGSRAIDFSYRSVGFFSQDMAPVMDDDNKIYFINNEGKKKYIFNKKIKFDYLGPMVDNILVVGYNGKYDYYDYNYNKLSSGYSYASNFNEDIATVCKDNKWYLINEKFETISDAYDEILVDSNNIACNNKRIIAIKDSVYYILNEEGKVVKKTDYDEIKVSGNGYLAYKKNGVWGFCTTDGKKIIKPQYDDALSFNNGYAAICKDGEWGYIKENGESFISPKFTNVVSFNASGCAFVSNDGENWHIIRLYKYFS